MDGGGCGCGCGGVLGIDPADEGAVLGLGVLYVGDETCCSIGGM